jgi:tetratricopeptide (TPR) repeat protein
VALRALGRREEALADLDAAVALNAHSPEAHNLRAIVLHELKRPEAALASYDATVALRPAYAEAWNNRGVALGEVGQAEAALASHDQAIALKPDFADAHYNRGVALDRLKRPAEALASLDAAIALAPGHARAQHNRGTALEALGRSDEAVASYDRAIALKPDYAEAFSNRGLALRNLQRLDEALASYDAAVALDAAYVDAHLGRSFLSLLAGDFEAGWREYEWRKAGRDAAGRPDPDRDWLGEGELAGQRLLVRHEQGLGDTLQFARYVPLLSARGAEVTLVVQPPLAGLLAASLPGVRVIAEGDPAPDADRHVSLMSLPLAFSTTLDTVPPPLRLDADARRADWAERLGAKTRPRIGLAWSGNPAHVNDRNRSIGFSTLAPLLGDAVEWIVLQNDIRPADAEAFAASGRARFFGEALADFADTAALADQLDLIITVDTSLAHLAGGLGKPVWVLLPYSPDWRWLLGRADSPWYPTARLFRQAKAGDWAGVIGEVGEELSRADFK